LGDSAYNSLLHGITLISPWTETFLEANSHSATPELPSRIWPTRFITVATTARLWSAFWHSQTV